MLTSAENHLTLGAYFNFSNIRKCFKIRTMFQVHIICSSRKKMEGYIFVNFKFYLNFKLHFCDKTWIHFVKIT